MAMRELSLFTGAGGGLLGTHLLGWEPCGYVEWNEYCQRVIAARIRDGYLREAPIFTDVREFVQSGAAEQYRGIADVVTAGFPCQPTSNAGMQLGAADPRDMWPATRDVIRIVRPGRVLLENVTGLLTTGYAGIVVSDLAGLGYMGRWGVISAGATGADHERERVWFVAYPERIRQPRPRQRVEPVYPAPNAYREASGLVDAVRRGTVPYVCRSHHGRSAGVDRLSALGNAQVPIVAATAWRLLS
jgi:DNA (cytosine-5)-methyltransferase 1